MCVWGGGGKHILKQMRFEVPKDIHQPVRIGYFRKLIKKRKEEQMIFPPLFFLEGEGDTHTSICILNRRQFLKEKAEDVEKARDVFINFKHLISSQSISRYASIDAISILQV